MCGIAGLIRFDNRPVDPIRLQRACSAMRHRGPDDQGVWIDESAGGRAGLAASRLAIFDPTPAGHQPFHRDGRFSLVYNGAIYNYREIRAELSALGQRFETESDTEVLLAICALWGVEGLHRCNGMWAFAFYESQTKSGFLCRDRFGVKPLLYAADASRLAFASEFRALQAITRLDESLDPAVLLRLVQFGWISGGDTLLRGVKRLEPGHFLQFDAQGSSSPQRYYSLPHTAPPEEPHARIHSTLRRVLGDAVVSRRVADVPVGAFLSGGLDSSIVVAHLAQASGRPLRTFSVGYADQRAYDETNFARLVACRFATEHHELIFSTQEVLDEIPRVLDHLGEPFGDSSIVPTALVSRFAGQHVRVALSGDGGDELFAGYWRYLGHGAAAAYARLPRWWRRWILEPVARLAAVDRTSKGANRARQFRKMLTASNTDALSRHLAWSSILAPEASSILGYVPHSLELGFRRAPTADAPTPNGRDPLNEILRFDLQNQLPADMLTKVDLAGMMHSLEVRTPFLDRRVVEFASALPSSLKLDRGIRKRVLIDAYRGLLPDEVLDRPKKGFELPMGEFLRGPLVPLFRDSVTRTTIESIGILHYDAIEAVFADHCARREDHADLLFALLSLCWWQDRRTAPT